MLIMYINHEEFILVENVLREYNDEWKNRKSENAEKYNI